MNLRLIVCLALRRELEDVTKEFDQLLTKDLPSLNDSLKSKGQPAIAPPPAKVDQRKRNRLRIDNRASDLVSLTLSAGRAASGKNRDTDSRRLQLGSTRPPTAR